ncbi:amidohydrolase [Aerococcus agrisoli]|uniref:Amidohydrolase n=1 Tax=Aerococcus agrisoli TaxID=2487350 RepID=A0A3N4G3H2_9LACT|nr:amidohydrolase [Aerococcus agrisoli]RPA55897.1 amidohydrolase [Aerococcus agrisoli]
MRTLIRNAWVLTMDDQMHEYHPGYVLLNEDIIEAVGPEEGPTLLHIQDLIDTADTVIDANDALVVPGFVNTHTHIGMIPFRSLGDDMKDRLRKLLFPLEADMTEDLVRASAQYAMAEMLLAGITTFADMYYFEDAIAEEADQMGIRALLGETIIGQPTPDASDNTPYFGLKMAPAFIERWQGHVRIQPMIAPHAPNTNDRASLESVTKIAIKYNVPVMIHVSEMDYEMAEFKDKYNQTPIEYLDSIGFFEAKVIAAHGIHAKGQDFTILHDQGVGLAHCVVANTKAAKGVAPIKEMLAADVAVGLGTDGPSSGNRLDLFTQMRTFAYAQKTYNHDRSIFPATTIVNLATRGGAKVLSLDHKIGQLTPGYQADITMIERKSLNMNPIFDPYSAIVYSAEASNVEAVWVAGQQLVANKTLTRFSEETISQRLQAQMAPFNAKVAEILGQE